MKTCFILVLFTRGLSYRMRSLTFMTVGSQRFPPVSQSSCGWRPASAAALARVALFSWATFTGGLLDCPGTLAGHKLTPRLGRVVCSSPGLNRSFESPLSGRWVRLCDTKADVAKWSSHTFPRHHNFPRILKKKMYFPTWQHPNTHTKRIRSRHSHDSTCRKSTIREKCHYLMCRLWIPSDPQT